MQVAASRATMRSDRAWPRSVRKFSVVTANRVLLAVIPVTIMIFAVILMPGIEQWLAAFGKTAQAKLMLGRIGLALPYATAAAIGTIFLFAANGAANIKPAGWSVVSGSVAAVMVA